MLDKDRRGGFILRNIIKIKIIIGRILNLCIVTIFYKLWTVFVQTFLGFRLALLPLHHQFPVYHHFLLSCLYQFLLILLLRLLDCGFIHNSLLL